jgi:predicted negative regulator of RcsB-dependent stress response
MPKRIFLIVVFFSLLCAKESYHFGLINDEGTQIRDKQKEDIINTELSLKKINLLLKDGHITDAHKMMLKFKQKKYPAMFRSYATLLECEILLNRPGKRFAYQAGDILEDAIKKSLINENDLPNAYLLLVNIKLSLNKTKEANYFAAKLMQTYENHPRLFAYGEIARARILMHQSKYKASERVLSRILTKTKDKFVAIKASNLLFSVYILQKQDDKAYNLIQQVLEQDLSYYEEHRAEALELSHRLTKVGMTDLSIKVLQRLVELATLPTSIEQYKFELADTYLAHGDLRQAKDLFTDITYKYPQTQYLEKIKIALDEILLREGKLDIEILKRKYRNSTSMKQKIMLKELLNLIRDERFEEIDERKSYFNQINPSIVKRFGYKNLDQIYAMAQKLTLKKYLKEEECAKVKTVLQSASPLIFDVLVDDNVTRPQLFSCLIEEPFEEGYEKVVYLYKDTKDARIIHQLEKIAYSIKNYEDAYKFSRQIEFLNDILVMQEELFDKFLIYRSFRSPAIKDEFYRYVELHPVIIEANLQEPMIVDIFYNYAMYLKMKKRDKKIYRSLLNLYHAQMSLNIRVYSPFVEIELAKYHMKNLEFDKAQKVLYEALDVKHIRPKDTDRVYYELSKLFKQTGEYKKYNFALDKCQNSTDDNMWNKLCKKMDKKVL